LNISALYSGCSEFVSWAGDTYLKSDIFLVFLRLSSTSLAYTPFSLINASFRMIAHTGLMLALSIS